MKNNKETRVYSMQESTLSCKAAIDATTFGASHSMYVIHPVPIETLNPPEEAGVLIQEEEFKEIDFIASSNQVYAKLAPNDRHEVDLWDATLKDGLDEY
ncbi:MAG: hypothetical protein R6V10_06460 [bacterium]